MTPTGTGLRARRLSNGKALVGGSHAGRAPEVTRDGEPGQAFHHLHVAGSDGEGGATRSDLRRLPPQGWLGG